MEGVAVSPIADAGAVTVRATVAVLVRPPPEAVIVTVAGPVVAVLEAEKVTVLVPAPGAAILAGAKLAVTPDGSPDAERVTAELNPPDGVTVRPTGTVPLRTTLTVEGAAVSARAGVGAVTVSATVAVLVRPPPEAVIVTVAGPVVAVLEAEKVTVLVPAPGAAILAGAKLAVTPDGSPAAERVTAELNPPDGVTVRPTGTVPLRTTLTVDGAAVSARAGAGAATVSATVAVFVKLPPVPVIVTVTVPSAAVLDAVKVIALDAKVAVTPDGSPDAEKVTVELNPPEGVTVRVVCAVEERRTVTAAGLAARVKLGGGVTVTATTAV